MKRHLFFMPLILAASCFLLSGCGTLPRAERASVVSESTDSLSKMLYKGIRQNNALQTSAKALAKSNADELKNSYYAFAQNTERLRSIADEIQDTSQYMNDQTVEYFDAWEKDLKKIRNNNLKDSAGDRRISLMDEFSAIAEAMEKLEEAYVKYERDLDDVENYLGNDLTPAGLKIAKSYLNAVSQNSPTINKATRDVLDSIEELKGLMSQ